MTIKESAPRVTQEHKHETPESLFTLLQNYCNVAINGSSIETLYPLITAAYRLDAQKAVAIINRSDPAGNTPLHIAASHGKHEIVQYLIGYGANINARNQKGQTPLEVAVTHQHSTVITLLLCSADPNIQNAEGKTAFDIAIEQKDFITACYFIEAGANPETQFQKNPSLIEASNHDGLRLLHAAASTQCYFTVNLLIKRGADINAQDSCGRTALHWAIAVKDFDTVKFLLQQGARLDICNKKGETSADLAISSLNDSGHENCKQSLHIYFLVRLNMDSAQDKKEISQSLQDFDQYSHNLYKIIRQLFQEENMSDEKARHALQTIFELFRWDQWLDTLIPLLRDTVSKVATPKSPLAPLLLLEAQFKLLCALMTVDYTVEDFRSEILRRSYISYQTCFEYYYPMLLQAYTYHEENEMTQAGLKETQQPLFDAQTRFDLFHSIAQTCNAEATDLEFRTSCIKILIQHIVPENLQSIISEVLLPYYQEPIEPQEMTPEQFFDASISKLSY